MVTACAAVGVVAWGLVFAERHAAFTIGLTESRYPQVARVMATLTEPTAVVISAQHSGSVRYYSGRLTVRWEYLDTDLDEALVWMRAHGHRPVFLLDRAEVAALRATARTGATWAALDWTPRYSFFNGETLYFDPADRGRIDLRTEDFGRYTRAIVPAAAPQPW